MNAQVQFQLTSKVLCTNTVELYVVIHRIDSDHSAFFFVIQVGITLFTVSHRKSLWKYHEVDRNCFFFLYYFQSIDF